MTPKEKAAELVDKMYFSRRYKDGEDYIPQQAWLHAKQCALIAVDEALNMFIEVHKALQTAGLLKFSVEEAATYKFWQEVKQEIEKI